MKTARGMRSNISTKKLNYPSGRRRRTLIKGSGHQRNVGNGFHGLANVIVSHRMRVDKRVVRGDALQVGNRNGVGRYPLASRRVIVRRRRSRRRCLWRWRRLLLLVRMMMMGDADDVTKVPVDNRRRFDAVHATRFDGDAAVGQRMKISVRFRCGRRCGCASAAVQGRRVQTFAVIAVISFGNCC